MSVQNTPGTPQTGRKAPKNPRETLLFKTIGFTDDLSLSDEDGLDDDYESAREDAGAPTDLFAGLKFYAQRIIQKTHEGRSVTKVNKNDIVIAAQKILKIVKQLEKNPTKSQAPTATEARADSEDVVSRIREVVREEVTRICGQSPPTKSPKPTQPTFAEIVQGAKNPNQHRSPPTSKPALIVSSEAEVRSSAETLQRWRQAVDFKKTKYSPAGVRFVSNNKIRVEFDTMQQRDDTLTIINSKNAGIKAEPSKTLNPMVIIKGISADIPPQSLTETILIQNDYNNDDDDPLTQPSITLKYTRKNRNPNLYNAVFMTTPNIFRDMMQRGRINIDHQRVHVEEHVPLMQCYHCLQFGHTKTRCPNEHPACSHCAAQTHVFKDCPVKNDSSKNNCINCTLYFKKHKINKTSNHSATSNVCPRIAQMTERLRSRISYG